MASSVSGVNLTLPIQQQPVIDSRGCMTLPWYRYYQNAQTTNNNLISIPNGTLLGNNSGQTGIPGPISIGKGLLLEGGALSAIESTLKSTDDLPEGRVNLYYTSRRAQDAVGEILTSPGSVIFNYTPGVSISADINLGRLWMLA